MRSNARTGDGIPRAEVFSPEAPGAAWHSEGSISAEFSEEKVHGLHQGSKSHEPLKG